MGLRRTGRRRLGVMWINRVWGLPRSRGPIPTERLAVGLAAHASEIGGCTYRSVRFALAQQGTGLDQEPA